VFWYEYYMNTNDVIITIPVSAGSQSCGFGTKLGYGSEFS